MSFEQFLSTVRKGGVAKASHFVCHITPPTFMTGLTPIIESIPFYVNGVNFPEFALATTTVKDNGLNREVVYDKMYGEITMSFTCDQAMLIKKFFDDWVKYPVLDKGGKFTYPKRYITDTLHLFQVNAKKEVAYSVILNNVYPKIVDDISASADSGSLATFNVRFVYESWDSHVTEYSMKDTKKPSKVMELLHRYFNIPTLEGLEKQITGIASNRLGGLVGEKTHSIDSRYNKRLNDILGQTKNKLLNL